MGFKDAKMKVIECLRSGKIRHEARVNVNIKNLLAIGAVTTEQVIQAILRAKGGCYECRPHDFDKSIVIHIIKYNNSGGSWYIKWYFMEPNTIFISVHE